MRYLVEKRFLKKVGLTLLVCGAAVQVVRFIISFVLQYSVIGNVKLEDVLYAPLNITWEFLGVLSSCACFAVVIYLTFIYGIKGGGEWLIAIVSMYGLVYFLTFYTGSTAFGLIGSAATAAILFTAFLKWGKMPTGISALVCAVFLMPYLSATVIYFMTTSGDTAEFAVSLLYGLLNLATDLLMLAVLSRLAGSIRARAIRKGGGNAEISLKGNIFSLKNPVRLTLFVSDLIFSLPSFIQALSVSIEDVNEYGLPVNSREWLSLFAPYITIAVHIAVGYLIMILVAERLEASYIDAEDKADAVAAHR